MLKFWMVVRVTGDDYLETRLPEDQAPRFMHWEQEAAEEEAIRLRQVCRDPDSTFVVMEAVAHTVPTLSNATVHHLRPCHESLMPRRLGLVVG